MSELSKQRSEDFLQISGQFKLGALVTESSHPVTADLSEVARQDIAAALALLFQVDEDVLKKFQEFAASGRAHKIAATLIATLKNGGRIFFTGCGSTGRLSILLDSVWRDFWRQQKNSDFENRAFSVMAGGDYALIKSVEGFEDFTDFGKKQMADLNVSAKDAVFAITEGGETSFVIGTAWKGVEVGAKVYFVYNNPDEILCEHVQRSREVIQDERIEKINLTTGPMAITGSTRMQATSIQLAVMLTVLEIVVRELLGQNSDLVPVDFANQFSDMLATLRSTDFCGQLAKLVALEEKTYRGGGKNNYFTSRFGIDVLTDTTERSPTYCTPPFRKFDDSTATESWAFLFMPDDWTDNAWADILKREPRCIGWSKLEVRQLVGELDMERVLEITNKIKVSELMRFKVGSNGIRYRQQGMGDGAVAVFSNLENTSFFMGALKRAADFGSRTAKLTFVSPSAQGRSTSAIPDCLTVIVPLPETNFLLDGVTRLAVKLVMNALSTATMVRLGRVMGNFMVWVVPSNLKLIDRATRYITKLTGREYAAANALLFEIIEYVEPRMKSDQLYPPVVEMAVMRVRENLANEEAERWLLNERSTRA
jgi:N-acetylmuramic acid 6-phosphate etherase